MDWWPSGLRQPAPNSPAGDASNTPHNGIPNLSAPNTELPDHIEETMSASVKLHADHHRSTTPLQRVAVRMVDLLGRTEFLGLLLIAMVCWSAGNVLTMVSGHSPIDPPPFAWMALASSAMALCLAVLILTAQKRDDQLAQHREQLTLELAILSDRKLAKIIQLLEESRRDNPLLDNRVDEAAEDMARPADPQTLADVVKSRHAEAEDARPRG
jgi:uncharacterized membrane protein